MRQTDEADEPSPPVVAVVPEPPSGEVALGSAPGSTEALCPPTARANDLTMEEGTAEEEEMEEDVLSLTGGGGETDSNVA